MHDVCSEVTPRNTLPRGHRPRPRSSFYNKTPKAESKNDYSSNSSTTTLLTEELTTNLTAVEDKDKQNNRKSLYFGDQPVRKALG